MTPTRNRVNQPTGYTGTGNASQRPHYVYGRTHDYIYYPIAWTDASTGTRYEKGYYDENGSHYDDVAFNRNGQYENVVCHCPYCDQDTVLNLKAQEIQAMQLECPSCGGSLEIRSQLDEYVTGSGSREMGNGSAGVTAGTAPSRSLKGCLIPLIVIAALTVMFTSMSLLSDCTSRILRQFSGIQSTSVTTDREDTLSLIRTSDIGYRIAAEGESAEKTLVWDESADSYYDAESECWVWYNQEVDPPVWQYWYEGISSDFGEYGWMEHDSDGWFVEESAGNWIELPDRYDTSGLWYFGVQEVQKTDRISLVSTGEGAFRTAGSGETADKTLVWDESADSYYDAESDCWVWYNKEIDPPVWQYWYEGISSDFGEYGWMEHDSEGWFIEKSKAEWIPLPSDYDVTRLWYIE